MEFEALVPSVPYVASVLAVGIFLWRVFVRMLAGMEARFDDRFGQIHSQFSQIDSRFEQVDNRFEQVDKRFEQVDKRFEQMESRFDNRFASLETRFDSLDKKVDGLAGDHNSLSRELSEFRGEMRGRLSMLVPPAAGET